jgi:YegS C-terminal NAD kinase beta sandwich-like domain
VTIRKGEAWGELRAVPEGTVFVRHDAGARRVAESARRADDPIPPLGLAGGDLWRTMGGRQATANIVPVEHGGFRLRRSPDGVEGGEVTVAPVDLGSVLIDGRQHWFVAHLVARHSWWHGRVVAAMNAEFIGAWDVAPRGHPNDGRLDVLDVGPGLSLRDRLRAWRRLPSGTHVPHPAIRQERVAAVQVEFDRPTPVWLDGERVGEGRRLSIRLEPDALLCAV